MNACDMEKSAENYFRSMADDLDPYPGNLKKHEVKQTTNDPQAPYGETHPSELKGNLPDMTHEQEAGLMEAMERKRLESVKEEIGPSGLTAKRLQELCKAQQREPLLSDDQITDMSSTAHDYTQSWLSMDKARAFYEAKITSGELMVAKTATNAAPTLCAEERTEQNPKGLTGSFHCSLCAYKVFMSKEPLHCPGCGAKIIE